MKPHSNLIYFNRFSKPRKRCRVKGNWELQFCHGKTAFCLGRGWCGLHQSGLPDISTAGSGGPTARSIMINEFVSTHLVKQLALPGGGWVLLTPLF